MRRAYHLDEPLLQQFGRYLGNLAHGDFGPSFQYREFTVTELIWTGFPVSLRVGGAGDAARRAGRRVGRALRGAAPEPAPPTTPSWPWP